MTEGEDQPAEMPYAGPGSGVSADGVPRAPGDPGGDPGGAGRPSRRRMRVDDDEVDLDDEVLDEREIAAAIAALRAARSAGFGDRDRRFTGRRYRPGTGDYE